MKEVKVIVPRSLADITLGQYQKYEAVLAKNEGNEQERFMQLKMIEIFCGVDFQTANKMPMIQFSEVCEAGYAVLQERPSFEQTFHLGETEFGFIPDLEQMTFGEFVDLESFISEIKDMHKAMAVLYRPIKQRVKDKYLIHEYEGDMFHEVMRSMPLSAASGSMLFFWNLGIDCLNVILKSSENRELKREFYQRREALLKSGDGTQQFGNSLALILQDLNQLRNLE